MSKAATSFGKANSQQPPSAKESNCMEEQSLEQKVYKKVQWDELMGKLGEAAKRYEDRGDSYMSDMLVEAVPLMEAEPDAPTRNAFIFANRINYRSLVENSFCEINKVWYTESVDSFFIANYDYKMFSWAIKRGFGEYIDNLCIRLPKTGLSEKEIKRLEDRIKQNT